jgi:starvation-inducible DNA-binding protein
MTTQEQLIQIFKDNFVAYFRSHAAHVNVTGRNFRSDHKLLEGVYTRRQEQIDKIGEILRSMGEYMPCDLTEIVADTRMPVDAIEGASDNLLYQVLNDLENLLSEFKELIQVADSEGWEEVGNYAQDQALDLEKSIWMLKATLD